MNKEYEKQVLELSNLWHSMIIASNYRDMEKRFSRINRLSTTELSVLRIVSEKDEVILKDIVNELDVPKSTLTNVIDRLEKYKFIHRVVSEKDRRAYKLELTKEGKLAQEEHIEFEKMVYGKVIGSLDTYEEREELLKLIRKITFNMLKK